MGGKVIRRPNMMGISILDQASGWQQGLGAVTHGDPDRARPVGLADNTRPALRESLQTNRKIRHSVQGL